MVTLNIMKAFFKGALVLTFVLTVNVGTLLAELTQVPLFLTASIDPNIMFIIDDSGSMFFEVTPDDLSFPGSAYAGFVFPRANTVYGPSDYAQSFIQVATVDENNAYSARTRSPQFNTTYYNPSITYLPWIRHDNTYYPNASITCAWHNPEKTGTCPTGHVNTLARNLTVNNTNYNSNSWRTCNSSGTCSSTTNSKTFWPATYFWHDTGNGWAWSDYTRVEIRTTTTSYTGHGRENRTDCAAAANATCSYDEEIQNFANWYTYYRSRILASRAGIGMAFAQQGENLRVGYGAINAGSSSIDNVNTHTIVRGVRPFSGANREAFFSLLYTRDIPASGTPLRKALDAAGQYYSRTDSRGPWSSTPGQSGGDDYECRHCYTILMTDGYWTGGSTYQADTSNARANVDNATGPAITGPGGLSYQYIPADPYRDSYSNTLSDIAMYYWNRDLYPSLPNRVPTSSQNEAFWQHMVTFGVGFGVTGTVDPDDAWAATGTGDSIAWLSTNPNADNCSGSECNARLDDLLHAAVNSRGGFFSAADPQTFANELTDTLTNIVNRTESSAAAIATNSTRLVEGSLIFQARFDSRDWSGELLAYSLLASDGSVGPVEWSTDEANKIPGHADRKIFTWHDVDKKGVSFKWLDVSSTQQAFLVDATRLEWLRGNPASEQRNSGELRNRPTAIGDKFKVLGDIINSDPLVVGVPDFRYQLLPPGDEKDKYADFRAGLLDENNPRAKMLYVGANDGMLHAFDVEEGVEKFAYVPAGVYAHLAELAKPDYEHQYYVDGSPGYGDAYIADTWKTVLVGSLGAGGRSVFALDVTDPDNFGANNVLWEFGYVAGVECDDEAVDVTGCEDMGYSFGTPIVARMKNGAWVAIFGNGYAYGDGTNARTAQLYIVDIADGTLIRRIDTGAGSADVNVASGLSSVAVVPDAQRIVKHAYAGDLQGNVWKFDLSGSDPDDWDVAFGSTPLFTSINNDGKAQPITSSLEVGTHPNGGYMVYFGTGKYFEKDDTDVTSPVTQSFYGLRDNLTSAITDRSALVAQTITDEGQLREDEGSDLNYRVVSENIVNYPPYRGWYMDLVSPVHGSQGERVVSAPLLLSGRIIFSTLIPIVDDPCSGGGTSWLMALDAISGARLKKSIFTIDNEVEGAYVSGIQSYVGIIGTPAVVGGTAYAGGSDLTVGEGIWVEDLILEDEEDFGRRSWRQLQ